MENENIAKNEVKEKCSLIDCMIIAMFSAKEYPRLLRISKRKLVWYVVVVSLLIGLVQYAIPVLGSLAGLGGVKGIFTHEVPQFCLEDGELYVEERIEVADEVTGVYLLIDTSMDTFTKQDVPNNMMQAVLISKSNMIVYSSVYGMGAMTEEEKFENLKGVVFSNQTVIDYSAGIYISFVFAFIAVWILVALEYLFTALLYAGFMYLLLKSLMPDATFATVYKVFLFAQTIGAIAVAVSYCLGSGTLLMAAEFFRVIVTLALSNKALLGMMKNRI